MEVQATNFWKQEIMTDGNCTEIPSVGRHNAENWYSKGYCQNHKDDCVGSH